MTILTDTAPIIIVQEVLMECCDEARLCALCDQVACFDHSDPYPVNCGVNGFTCGECHKRCPSTACAIDNADPDDL